MQQVCRSALALSSLVFLVAAAPSRGGALPERAAHVADYDLRVTLDPQARTLRGAGRIVWRNPAPEPVGELWFHLYLNAFKNSSSTFYRESGGQLRGDRMPEDGWGHIDVTSLRRADGADLLPGATFEHPDDDNADDRTAWRVPLPEPVPAGGEIGLDVAFEATLPRVFARTGYFQDYFLVGQWFPKLAVYEPAGMRGRAQGGWNCHQFHANSEFYANFGAYRVEITLPARFVVGATGRRSARRENADGSVTHVFEQADVIDFAWAASPRFLEVEETFSADRDVTPAEYRETAELLGRSLDEVRLSDVRVRLLLQPERAPQASRYMAAAKAAIKWFGLWYGRYPYPTLTVVDPAYGAGGSGGMEYPTFITGGSSLLLNRWPFERVLAPEAVTVHEFGHQYWQSMVASNEFEESWLDEGFNSYSTAKVMERVYGPWRMQVLGLRLGGLEMARVSNSAERMFDRVRSASWAFSPGNYGFNSYARTELTLATLEALVGRQAMARVMRTYHERWRFRHPRSEDFYAVVNEVTGADHGWFFGQTIERPGILDDEVASLRSERVREPRGVFGEGAAKTTVGAADARAKEKEAKAAGTERPWRTVVVVRRRGAVRLPTSLLLRHEGGETRLLPLLADDGVAPQAATANPASPVGAWLGEWKRIELETDQRVVAATIDPDDRLLIDVNRLNNSRRLRSDARAAAHWGARFTFWLQQALALVGL